MSAISWANLESFTPPPASVSTASSGDDWFRSFESSVALGLSTSWIWPGSGGGSLASIGISQFGNARAAVAGNSATTGGFGDGFLLLNTAHASLHHIGSTTTSIVGHSSMVDHGAVAGRWLVQTGTITLSSSDTGFGQKVVTYPIQYTAAPPWIQLVGQANAEFMNLSVVGNAAFTSSFSGHSASTTTWFWLSEGTI